MKDHFEQIREQIHEIRNFLGPLDVKLEGLDYQVKRSRASFELKSAELESGIAVNSSKIARHSSEIALHSEQIKQIQIFLKMPQSVQGYSPLSVHEDKKSETPPITPPNDQ